MMCLEELKVISEIMIASVLAVTLGLSGLVSAYVQTGSCYPVQFQENF